MSKTEHISGFYLLLAALWMLLSILGFPQQVGEGQRLQGAGARGSGIPEWVVVPWIPPAPDRAERPRPHAACWVDAVDADHRNEFRDQSKRIKSGSDSGSELSDWTLQSLQKVKSSDRGNKKNFTGEMKLDAGPNQNFFYPKILEREKEWGTKRSFNPHPLLSPLPH